MPTAQDVDRLLIRQDPANRHRGHPLGGDRSPRAPGEVAPPVTAPVRPPAGRMAAARTGRRRGLRTASRTTRHGRPAGGGTPPRLPRYGREARGEILVVNDSRDPGESVFWLDDDLPHERRWAEEK